MELLNRNRAFLVFFFVRTGDGGVGVVLDVDGDLLRIESLPHKAISL